MKQIKSISSVTGNNYCLPTTDDKKSINDFAKLHQDKKVVAVQGLGFVGTVMSLVVANSDHGEYTVIGLDRATEESYWKIAEINAGICPVASSDPLVSQFFENAKQKQNFYATHDSIALEKAAGNRQDLKVKGSKARALAIKKFDRKILASQWTENLEIVYREKVGKNKLWVK